MPGQLSHALERMFSTHVSADHVAAIVFEAQQGEGGFLPAPARFVEGLRRLSDQHGIVLVADEVQTGFGRTGRMFAMEHFDVEPDLVVVAKSIAGGLPLSGVVGRAEIMDNAHQGRSVGTFIGNPVALAAALAVLDVFEEEDLVARGVTVGNAIRERMLAWKTRWPQRGRRPRARRDARDRVRGRSEHEGAGPGAHGRSDRRGSAAGVDLAEGRRVRELHPCAVPAFDLGRRARRGSGGLGRCSRFSVAARVASRRLARRAPAKPGNTSHMTDCGSCGAALPEDARFCATCGAPVERGVAGLDERKLATVLFADLVGSTAKPDAEDPERVRARLDRFYEAMAEEIGRTGGTVEKFAGDSVMAAFGAPTAQEDHAERALHAALAMQHRLAEEFGGELQLRIGVNTGEVVVGQAREASSFVTGDAVNVGARLEQAAAPAEVLAGERTVAVAGGAFEFGEQRVIEAKGKPGGRRVSTRSSSSDAHAPSGVGGLRRVFVGRETELELLLATYRRAATQRRAPPRDDHRRAGRREDEAHP